MDDDLHAGEVGQCNLDQGSHVEPVESTEAAAKWRDRDGPDVTSLDLLRQGDQSGLLEFHGTACRPLVCTGGWPSAAASALLGQLRAGGAALRHHGDFDWDGLAIHQALVRDAGVMPWRYDAATYDRAVQGSHALLRPLTTRRRTVSGALAEELAHVGCLVPEELVLDGLLEDLRRRADA